MLTVQDDTGIVTGKNVIAYTTLLVLFSLSLTLLGVSGLVYFFGALLLGAAFIAVSVRFFVERSSARARVVLITSYMYLLTIITLMFVDRAITSF